MINVLSEALPHLDELIKRKPITIIKREIKNTKGFATSSETSQIGRASCRERV